MPSWCQAQEAAPEPAEGAKNKDHEFPVLVGTPSLQQPRRRSGGAGEKRKRLLRWAALLYEKEGSPLAQLFSAAQPPCAAWGSLLSEPILVEMSPLWKHLQRSP